MPFERLFKWYDSDNTLIGFIDNSRVVNAECEFLRQGGCGSGSMVLHDPFRTSNIQVGQHIQFFYDSVTPWYLGRVEEVDSSSPNRTTIRLYGWFSILSDIPVGGRGPGDPSNPIHYLHPDQTYEDGTTKSKLFVSDPDKEEHELQATSTITEMLSHIADNYVIPNSPVGFHDIDTPLDVSDNKFVSMVFRGEESCSQIFRQAAVSLGWASWGIDENGILFVKNLPISTSFTFQEGVNVMNLRESVDRSLMFNRLILTGGPIYGTNGGGFYHYRANVIHFPSRALYGEKKISITLPWLRCVDDVENFCQKFMQEYAGPTTRYQFATIGLPSMGIEAPIRPWVHRVGLLDRDGTILKNAVPTSIQYSFDETPKITSITLGPEELQFPTDAHPNRHEDFDPKDLGDAVEINCKGFQGDLAPIGGFPSFDCVGGSEGFLASSLSAPTCGTDPPTSVTVNVYKRNASTDELESTGDTVEVFNNDPYLTGVSGAYCRWKNIGGINKLTYLSCNDGLANCTV